MKFKKPRTIILKKNKILKQVTILPAGNLCFDKIELVETPEQMQDFIKEWDDLGKKYKLYTTIKVKKVKKGGSKK